MKYHIQVDADGNIKALMTAQLDAGPIADWILVESENVISVLTHYWDGTQPIEYSVQEMAQRMQSMRWHRWVPTVGWIDERPLSVLRSDKLAEINAERERRNHLPIDYAGAQFDADALGQRNVQAWMTNINAGIALPAGFVWRDYDNVDHPADAAFVSGLGAAITLRGTLLYQAAWAKKAELAGLTTIAEIDVFDPLENWP